MTAARGARDDLPPGFPKGLDVDVSSKLARELFEVLSRLGCREGVEEHGFLDAGQRIRVLDFVAEDPLQHAAIEPLGSQLEWGDLASWRRLRSFRVIACRGRQFGNRRVTEQVGGLECQACLARSRDQPDPRDRVDAQLEEIVVYADAAQTGEIRHHFAPGFSRWPCAGQRASPGIR